MSGIKDNIPHRTDYLAVAAMLALLFPALLPLMLTISPELYFQFDPRQVGRGYRVTELGPAGAAWLVAYSLLASAVALAVAARRGVRMNYLILGLAGLGMAACAVHLVGGSLNDRVHAGAWIGAAALAVGAAHLGQLPDARRWAGAALVAMLIPVCLDAAYYVFVSHPMTVEQYMANRDEVLASRGWAPGSAEAIKYEQRLSANDATGAFGLSNVLGSFAAALALAALTLGAFALRSKRWAGLVVTGGLAAMGVLTLHLTQSKGAMAAAVAGAVLLVGCVAAAGRPRLRVAIGMLALLMILGANGGVLARGAMGPPDDATGERSILFRYHYLQGTADMIAGEAPRSILVGVGADGFGQLYPRYKNPISPESVTSAHHVFADWIAMLGLVGVALSAMLLVLMWRGARAVTAAAREEDTGSEAAGNADTPRLPRADVACAAILGAAVFGGYYVVAFAKLGPETGVLWLAGLMGFVAAVVVLVQQRRLPAAAWSAAVLVAGGVLVVHGQIEMTFFNIAAVGPAGFVVGLVGSATCAGSPRRGSWRYAPAFVLAIVAVVFASGNASLLSRQQAHVAAAEAALRAGDWTKAVDRLDRSAALIPVDVKAVRWRIALRMEMAIELARRSLAEPARERLDAVLDIVEDAEASGLSPLQAARYRAQTHRLTADLFDDADARGEAALAMRDAAALSPYNVHLHLDAADFTRQAGDAEAAEMLYRRTLELDANAYLDPAHQLSDAELSRVRGLLEGDGQKQPD